MICFDGANGADNVDTVCNFAKGRIRAIEVFAVIASKADEKLAAG